MEFKKQRIALINTLLKYYDASNNELSNRLYQDIIHFTVGLSYEVANNCHDIAETLHLKGKKSYES
tara:strand:+ start:2668 stop:2865 length:198 start_codon:yes stop_codon:yes gene_type:complete